jgi:diguanylate cyclase (GGDEF)-like protein
VWNLVQRAIAQRQNYECEYRIITQSGQTKWVWERGQGIFDDDDQLCHLEGFVSDISDRIKAEQQLKYDALHDSLTGLPNRNCLMHRLDLALKRTTQDPDFQFAVLFLDLDNFKVVNDSLGHLVGDELLINVAELLGRSIRDTDVAARLGGDEFVILAEAIQGIQEAAAIADRVLAELRSPFAIARRNVYISASIGIVAGGGTHERAADLLRDADLAMYRAKRAGRAQYAIFDPNMHLQAMQRLHLEQDLRQALQKDEFVLYYQPIVALNTLQIQGFEALVRWQHPQRGLVSPLEFIPIAEETGLIVPLGQWILNTACLQLAQWQAQFPERTLKMSVNLSVQQLQTPLVSDLVEALTLSQIAADSLVLEITESMLVEHIEPIQTLLEEVRKMGIYLSIDDFGTGYSSLSYLGKLPVDTLKIDRAFVSPDDAEARNQVIAESIIALSNLLELGVIAEGIQSLEQLEWLKHLGCKLGQGYLFSAPVPADQATQLLHQNLSLQTPR